MVTQRGRAVAVLTPAAAEAAAAAVATLHGFMRGSVVIPGGFDLTAPVAAEVFDAEPGILHQ